MSSSAAKISTIKEFDIPTSNGDLHVSIEPNTPEGILDAHGVPVERSSSMMVRLDKKAGESVTLTRGTLWFVGTLVAVVPVILLIAVYTVTVAMGYQSALSQVKEIDGRVTKLEAAFTEIQNLKLSMNNVANDVATMKASQKDADIDRKDILKNMGDIRILLAQKHMEGQ